MQETSPLPGRTGVGGRLIFHSTCFASIWIHYPVLACVMFSMKKKWFSDILSCWVLLSIKLGRWTCYIAWPPARGTCQSDPTHPREQSPRKTYPHSFLDLLRHCRPHVTSLYLWSVLLVAELTHHFLGLVRACLNAGSWVPTQRGWLSSSGWDWETLTWGLWASWSVHPSLPLSSPLLLLRNVKWYLSVAVPGFQSLIWLCASFMDGTYFREISSELLTASCLLNQLIFSRCGAKGNMAKFCFLKGWANGPSKTPHLRRDPDYFMQTHLSLNPSWSTRMMEDNNMSPKARKKEHLN